MRVPSPAVRQVQRTRQVPMFAMGVVFASLITLGCQTPNHVGGIFANYHFPLHVKGTLADVVTGEPIDGAEVIFVSASMNRPDGESIGHSEGGKIDIYYVCRFGKLLLDTDPSPEFTFEIQVTHPGYSASVKNFDADSLTGEEYYLVDLGEVTLIPVAPED